jgi:hypothetical protein
VQPVCSADNLNPKAKHPPIVVGEEEREQFSAILFSRQHNVPAMGPHMSPHLPDFILTVAMMILKRRLSNDRHSDRFHRSAE